MIGDGRPSGPRRGPLRRSATATIWPDGTFLLPQVPAGDLSVEASFTGATPQATRPSGPRRGPLRRSNSDSQQAKDMREPSGPRRGPLRRSELPAGTTNLQMVAPSGPRRGPLRRSDCHDGRHVPACAIPQVPAGDLSVEASGRCDGGRGDPPGPQVPAGDLSVEADPASGPRPTARPPPQVPAGDLSVEAQRTSRR